MILYCKADKAMATENQRFRKLLGDTNKMLVSADDVVSKPTSWKDLLTQDNGGNKSQRMKLGFIPRLYA